MIRTARTFVETARIANSVYGPPRAAYAMARIAFRGALSAAGVRHPWVKQMPNPVRPKRLPGFKLFAILGTWMEADVVEATVRNAFTQGCDRVFLVDNDSPDETVVRARSAGADLVGSFESSGTFDADRRIGLINEAVERISAEDGSDHIWWQFLDADEFPHGPRGLTVREFLDSLDEAFRIVGTRWINHYPGSEPHYLRGFHPLDFQPLCEELPSFRCSAFHNKHSLQRYDRLAPRLLVPDGYHRAESIERPLFEPTEATYCHHFPFRERSVSAERLARLFADSAGVPRRADSAAEAHMETRLQTLDAVYSQNWQRVGIWVTPSLHWRRPRIEPQPWSTLAPPQDVAFKRWYAYRDVAAAISASRAPSRNPVSLITCE